jgi:hypothetical protein
MTPLLQAWRKYREQHVRRMNPDVPGHAFAAGWDAAMWQVQEKAQEDREDSAQILASREEDDSD